MPEPRAAPTPEPHLQRRLVAAVTADPVCATILHRMPHLQLPEWWLTGGAVFQNVWNCVEGRPPGQGIADYDVFYFDDTDLTWEAEDRVIRRAAALFAHVPATIEVRNEARVHLWYEERFGTPAAPFRSAADAIDAFAATTCCVGLTRRDGGIGIHAPHGLSDVFAMRLRPNHRLAPRGVYESKAAAYARRWPTLAVDPW